MQCQCKAKQIETFPDFGASGLSVSSQGSASERLDRSLSQPHCTLGRPHQKFNGCSPVCSTDCGTSLLALRSLRLGCSAHPCNLWTSAVCRASMPRAPWQGLTLSRIPAFENAERSHGGGKWDMIAAITFRAPFKAHCFFFSANPFPFLLRQRQVQHRMPQVSLSTESITRHPGYGNVLQREHSATARR